MVNGRINDTKAVLGHWEALPANAALRLAMQYHFELKLQRVPVHGIVFCLRHR
jgi:hypothetical protein